MDVFQYRDELVERYSAYIRSFINIREPRVKQFVDEALTAGELWPEPLIQLNPAFHTGPFVDDLVREGLLHQECARVFRTNKGKEPEPSQPLRLHRHQEEAIRIASGGHNYVLTTGTGSGKSLAYILPIVNHVLRHGTGRGIKAIVVYPMNALANSQYGELEKFLCLGYPGGQGPVRFALYTGQEHFDQHNAILDNPPDILLTNYVMLELILTRPRERKLIEAAQGLRFLVLDELHTYRGRQGADVALLVRRVRNRMGASNLQVVGTSATLAGSGNFAAQRLEVAAVARKLFGAPVYPDQVIGETLRRATPERTVEDPSFRRDLAARLIDNVPCPPATLTEFLADPLSGWIESVFGVTREEGSDRLTRAMPISLGGIHGAAARLANDTGVPVGRCSEALRTGLLGGYRAERQAGENTSSFAFRLHQFISRGDAVYASLESEKTRHITMQGQQFVPGDRGRVMLPLVFCRECGQEYYCVRLVHSPSGGKHVLPRRLSDGEQSEDEHGGFLFHSITHPWPTDDEAILDRLPEDWLEEHRDGPRVRRDRRPYLPEPLHLGTDGRQRSDEEIWHYIRAPFRFCLQCGVTYNPRQRSDFGKLATLSSEGRSTATTIISLFAIRALHRLDGIDEKARKLLSFTDNRQDASLQAGHFNDFVEIGQLRAALYAAVAGAGPRGIKHDELSQRVAEALALPPQVYTGKEQLRFQDREDADEALQDVLGYRLYHDLRRGWRVTAPNLEQCGLLTIHYPALDEVCASEDLWADRHPALAIAAPSIRKKIAQTLLDYMRRELAIKVTFLERGALDRMRQKSSQQLIPPWAIDENERLEGASVLYPRSTRAGDDDRTAVYLSPRGGFGQYLRRQTTFGQDVLRGLGAALRLEDTEAIIRHLLEGLEAGRLIQTVVEAKTELQVPGYQLRASAMRWIAGDGTIPFHDPIRVPNQAAEGSRVNPFFVDFYQSIGGQLIGVEAREHTAQVPYEDRLRREERFKEGKLPILYCSPTMELGVDIAGLNVVNLRNIPPTPANYAQRSGRAGRSGQPALVFSYCSTGSAHDQYFFKRPHLMVAGQVRPPRLDLANEDLIRAHVQGIWLAETGLDLGRSLKDLLDVAGTTPSLDLLDHVRAAMTAPGAKDRARGRAQDVLASARDDLEGIDWYTADWLDTTLAEIETRFDQACNRWRDLYRSAMKQASAQDRIIRDASRSLEDKRQAETLRREAEAQLKLLTESDNVAQSDFYSYRYFAGEGFLPGYSFPRLPLSAYIPARRGKQGTEEFLSRPRFLAISEFGPRAVVYHEGSRYLINRVILPVSDEDLLTMRVKRCGTCGYIHPIPTGEGPDLCGRCDAPLEPALRSLLRMQNVSTKRRDKINSDEEERFRLGYEIRTGLRFAQGDGHLRARIASVKAGDEQIATLTYGHAATIWRINMGWTRRKNKAQHGFVLDIERGYWARSDAEVEDEGDPMSQRTTRVIPYVEDRRNCLVFEPASSMDEGVMASLQAALKRAIAIEFQLEDNELAAEPLPDPDNRRLLLFYESAEGGAGVLRRLLDEPLDFARVARRALDICHYDSETGADNGQAPNAHERCEAACYDCLMSYGNQGDHLILDRARIRSDLLQLAGAVVTTEGELEPPSEPIWEHTGDDSGGIALQWFGYLRERGHVLPTPGRVTHDIGGSQPDFLYTADGLRAAIYVDGDAEREARDRQAVEDLEDRGYTVIRFNSPETWPELLARYDYIFGTPRKPVGWENTVAGGPWRPSDDIPGKIDLDLFDPAWRPLLQALAEHFSIAGGGDVAVKGRVIGAYLAEACLSPRSVRLVSAADPAAEQVIAALHAQGHGAVLVHFGDVEDTLAAVREALEG